MPRREAKQVARLKNYQIVFGSTHGKEVLYDLMETHHVLNSCFSKDPHIMAFNEGERNAVLRILTLLKIDPIELAKRIDDREKENEQDEY